MISEYINQNLGQVVLAIVILLWWVAFKLPKDIERGRQHRESKRLVEMVVTGQLTAAEYQAAGGDPAALRKVYLSK